MCQVSGCINQNYDGGCTLPKGDPCSNPVALATEKTNWLCPSCQEKEEDVYLHKLGPGLYRCQSCTKIWTEAELACSFTRLLARLIEERDEARSKALTSGSALERVYASLADAQAQVEAAL